MTSISRRLMLSAGVMLASAAFAWAQQSPGVLTNTTPTAVARKKPPTSATPEMINEAIQRSQARAAREQQTGRPQQWGSEEPFTYNPAQKNFTSQHQ
jgi:hypothetical protein